jgi:hypothetical protein
MEPCMKERPSIFSNDSLSPNYRGSDSPSNLLDPYFIPNLGFMNLLAIILVVTNFRLVMENLLNNGILLKWSMIGDYYGDFLAWPCLTTALEVPLFVYGSHLVQKFTTTGTITETWVSSTLIHLHILIPSLNTLLIFIVCHLDDYQYYSCSCLPSCYYCMV